LDILEVILHLKHVKTDIIPYVLPYYYVIGFGLTVNAYRAIPEQQCSGYSPLFTGEYCLAHNGNHLSH